MTKLSVNINKIALIRNSRGGNNPNVLQMATDLEKFGADGITVHPRPDQRHIRYSDVFALKKVIQTELNVEGNPTPDFIKMVSEVVPHQVTMVPDAPDALTSDAGWDTVKHADFLAPISQSLKAKGIRVSVFINPEIAMVEGAAKLGIDRVELYTESYAKAYQTKNRTSQLKQYQACAQKAHSLGLGINAGHDLDRENLFDFCRAVTPLNEVSIGHALVCDALYFGLENTVQIYQQKLGK